LKQIPRLKADTQAKQNVENRKQKRQNVFQFSKFQLSTFYFQLSIFEMSAFYFPNFYFLA